MRRDISMGIPMWSLLGLCAGSCLPDPTDFPVLPPLSYTLSMREVDPALGPTSGGVRVSVEGEGFTNGARVVVAGTPLLQVSVESPTRLSFELPAHPELRGKVPVEIQNPDGRSVMRSDLFSYFPGQLDFDGAKLQVGRTPTSIIAADINADHNVDLLVASTGNTTLSTFYGRPQGGFIPRPAQKLGSAPQSLAAGDFNRDGVLDLVVGAGTNQYVNVLLSMGREPLLDSRIVPTGSGPHAVAVSDLNADGISDVAVASYNSNNVCVLFASGTGSLRSSCYRTGIYASGVAIADFDGDGLPDLAVTSLKESRVGILLNSSATPGSFSGMQPFDSGPGGLPVAVAAGDLNENYDFII